MLLFSVVFADSCFWPCASEVVEASVIAGLFALHKQPRGACSSSVVTCCVTGGAKTMDGAEVNLKHTECIVFDAGCTETTVRTMTFKGVPSAWNFRRINVSLHQILLHCFAAFSPPC